MPSDTSATGGDADSRSRARQSAVYTALLTPILEEAERTGTTVSIHVERENPAQRLYARLGFVEVTQQGVYLLLERRVKIAS